MKKISIIVPCYNESSSLNITYGAISKVLETIENYTYEVIFVDDGSKDDTLSLIKDISFKDKKIKYVAFSKNFGKEAGMLAGLKYTSGDVAIIMDADLQHPPSLIPKMISIYETGFDQVIAKRSRKGEKFYRKWMTILYYKIINNLIDVELVDGIGDFRLLSRRAVDTLINLPEYNRFSKGLFNFIGFDKKVIEYQNEERVSGESKWKMKDLLNYAFDGLFSFNSKPLRILIYLGILIIFLSLCYIVYAFIGVIIYGIETPGYFTIISAVLLLGGVQLISIGIIGEYVGRIFYEVKKRPHFIIKETNVEKEKNILCN